MVLKHLLVVALLAIQIMSNSATLNAIPSRLSKDGKQDGKQNALSAPLRTLRAGVELSSESISPISQDHGLQSGGKKALKTRALKWGFALWGVVQVVGVLANAVKRLIPVALQPFVQHGMTPFHWTLYVVWTAYMIYAEGYQAFQLKFSPLVVKRALMLSERPSVMNWLLSGPYCMGLFDATRKRMIVGWSVTIGVFSLVGIVKKLPYPYRSIIDAGVVMGLSYGALSICFQFVRALFGREPNVDPCFHAGEDKAKEK